MFMDIFWLIYVDLRVAMAATDRKMVQNNIVI